MSGEQPPPLEPRPWREVPELLGDLVFFVQLAERALLQLEWSANVVSEDKTHEDGVEEGPGCPCCLCLQAWGEHANGAREEDKCALDGALYHLGLETQKQRVEARARLGIEPPAPSSD